MMSIQASAPGKLMLAGEYVVAAGLAPALAISVGPRAVVSVRDAPNGSWLVDAPDLGLASAQAQAVPVLHEVLELFPGIKPGRITVSSELGAGPLKPGLGGSSAVCVAAAHALAGWSGRPPPGLPDIIAAHRRAQGGVGSGYDVATAHVGGLVVFGSSSFTGGAPLVESPPWPSGLHAAVFFSGRGASTREQLERVTAWRNEDTDSYDACIEPLAAETIDFIRAFREGNVPRILLHAAQLQEELAFFDRVGDLGIIPTGPLQLAAVIEDAGAIARTAGAGGGDCMWALSDDPETLERATVAATELGFTRLPISIGGPGARIEGA
jgi:phosphomevalonate kinase